MDPEKAKQWRPAPVVQQYNTRDAIIYALGIGCNVKEDLHFLYEAHQDFQVFPTFVVKPGLTSVSLDGTPGIAYDLQRILHGEQYIEILNPIPEDGEFRTECEVVDILDKGSAAVILTNVTTYDNKTNKKLSFQQMATFQVGSGKFGGPRTNPREKKALPVPQRKPDRVVEVQTTKDQAALYRYGSGDMNPLHIDPDFAKASGFPTPILHGLCSLGVSTKAVIKEYGGNDGHNLKAVKVRFSAPVIPGQTLVVEMWKEGNRIHFQTKAKESGKTVIANAYVDLLDVKPAQPSETTEELVSDAIFEQINEQLPNQKDIIKKINGVVLYDITKNGKHAAYYTLDLKNGPVGKAFKGQSSDKPIVTVTVDDQDFLKIVTGGLGGMKAFMTGKLKAKGNVIVLQKLQGVLSGATKSKL
ncbi:unnamed protein product [Bursaphelenchus xylophilus]|uniref:(pine wood nematode) hypothetical protein n=1 Tax=Bursaphelenchus xylophilus TaxID=6326 RepID=A0A1I7SWQ5_BURXY|nr:unnamed protein product [Bursaphelenchus xylophilus]CAG9099801.1 unnamed protein product [Bursaphelenchus xylophilus]